MLYKILQRKNTKTVKGITFFDMLYKTFTIPEDFSYVVVTVTAEYVARPDLISLASYSTDDYADIICKVNGISNPFELQEGTNLVIPDFSHINRFLYTDDSLNNQSANDTDSKIDTQKRKNESRKANEQIIGDSNFRIDKNNKIVIY